MYSDDGWEIHITATPKKKMRTVSMPVPLKDKYTNVSDEKLSGKNYKKTFTLTHDSKYLSWYSNSESITDAVSYSAKLKTKAVKIKEVFDDNLSRYSKVIKAYLVNPPIEKKNLARIVELEKSMFEPNETKLEKAKKIFYYIDEEIQRDSSLSKLSDTLNLGRGSSRLKAQLLNILARRQGIPARTILYVRLPKRGEPLKEKYFFLFSNEIYLGDRWVPVDANNSYWGYRPKEHIVFHRNVEGIKKEFSKKRTEYVIKFQRILANKFNKKEYASTLQSSKSFINWYSFYKLPLPVQLHFYQLLLIPLGTLVLCVARNMIGIPTFGIFTPILLTLFFNETSLFFGISFFTVAIILGFMQRTLLNKLYLLAVPRLSIILVLIVMLLSLAAHLAPYFPNIHQGQLNFFPLVVVTVFIERFSIMLSEDGVKNTLQTLLGTLVISILIFFLFKIKKLQIFVFTNPEVLITIIGLLIVIGKYKGYRLSELLRFRSLISQHKKKYV